MTTGALTKPRRRGLVGAIRVGPCVYCKKPVVACTMRNCLAHGWVHLLSRLHHCPGGRLALPEIRYGWEYVSGQPGSETSHG